MAYNKIGFHLSSTGNRTGYGDYITALDNAGIPAVCMTVGGEGLGDIVSKWRNGSTVNHTAVVRYMPNSGEDIPRYDMSPSQAADEWLNWYVPKIGSEVYEFPTRIITKHGNELDKNRIQWLADFYTALHPKLLQRTGLISHRIACFSFASGEPERTQWESILPFLELTGNNPDKFVIGLHEYSYDKNDILSGEGSKIGRVSVLFDVCDSHNIQRPKVIIHEFGWELWDIAQPTDKAIQDIDTINRLYYSRYPEILGAGCWTLQDYQGSGICDKVQRLIEPITQLSLNTIYDGDDPPPNPEPTNKLLNPSFENGWYHPNGIPELQTPNNWEIWFTQLDGTWQGGSTLERISEYIPNPFDNNTWAQFVRPEVRVIPRNQLPANEQDLFILDGDHTLKIFKGFGSWQGGLVQEIYLTEGEYQLTLNVFGDLVKSYEDNQKVWADDPGGRDGMIRFNFNGDISEWISIVPGFWNLYVQDFTVEEAGTAVLKIEFMCPFPLNNSGLFMDEWSIMKTSIPNDCECGALTAVKTTALWIPQYNQMSQTELENCIGWAINGFDLPDGTKTSGGHMLCPSHVDALRIHTEGLTGSILGVAYPEKIGTGVTPEWLQNNCPCVFNDGKQVVFLGDDNSQNPFLFTNVPVITR